MNTRLVSQTFSRACTIPIQQGVAFNRRDNLALPIVVMINEATADHDFAGENPVGKRINFGGVDSNNQPSWMEVVGVVANVRSIELQEAPAPEVYTCALQDPFATMSAVIRTTVAPSAIPAPLRAAAQGG